MEQFVLGIFQEHLAKFLIGFKKEQVNANLLNGKGEIHNVNVNCTVINEIISKFTPYIELESIHVSKVSFYVTSWTNLRKSPICIDIDQVTVKIIEPLGYDKDRIRQKIRQITRNELQEEIRLGLIPKRTSPYNLFDRILDNVTVDIANVRIHFQPCGTFKTRRVGPWTPPEIIIDLCNIRLVSVNEYGDEANPDEVWHHNHHRRDIGTYLLYKKLEMECSILLYDHSTKDTIQLAKCGNEYQKVEIQLAIDRRINDGEYLSMQIDVKVQSFTADLSTRIIPVLAQLVTALMSLQQKNRAVVDPLKCVDNNNNNTHQQQNPTVEVSLTESSNGSNVVAATTSNDSNDQLSTTTDAETSNNDTVSVSATSKDGFPQNSLLDNNDDSDESSSESDDDDEDQDVAKNDTELLDNNKRQQQQAIDDGNNSTRFGSPSQRFFKRKISTTGSDDENGNQPVIVLPSGIVLHKKLSLSVSIQKTIVTGTYSEAIGEQFQVAVTGCVLELIWPKSNHGKGGYIQASVAHVAINEMYQNRYQTILSSGPESYNPTLDGPIEQPRSYGRTFDIEELFPVFEDRAIRPDQFGLEGRSPEHAIGVKVTFDFLSTNRQDMNTVATEDLFILLEMNVEKTDMIFDSFAWARITKFLCNVDNDTFDLRWVTGDWKDLISPELLVDCESSGTTKIEDSIQPLRYVHPFKNRSFSTDLFNATIRMSKIGLRVPAIVTKDLRAHDIVIGLNSATFSIASALPRTLTDPSVKPSFPHKDTDLIYQESGLPFTSQEGSNDTISFAVARGQIILKGVTISLKPLIPYNDAPCTLVLLTPTNMTTILSYEARKTKGKDQAVLYGTIVAQDIALNIDFDNLVSLVCTLYTHVKCVVTLKDTLHSAFASDNDGIRNGAVDSKTDSNRDLQQFYFWLVVGVQVQSIAISLWRQNICKSSLPTFDQQPQQDNKYQYIPLLKIVELRLLGLQFGVETALHDDSILMKMCISEIKMLCFDFKRVCEDDLFFLDAKIQVEEEDDPSYSVGDEQPSSEPSEYMMNVMQFNPTMLGANSIGVRVAKTNSVSIVYSAVEVVLGDAVVWLRVSDIAAIVCQITDALAAPALSKLDYEIKDCNTPRIFFDGTVGNFLQRIMSSLLREEAAKVPASKKEELNAFSDLARVFTPESVDALIASMTLNKLIVCIPTACTNTSTPHRRPALRISKFRTSAAYARNDSISHKYLQDLILSNATHEVSSQPNENTLPYFFFLCHCAMLFSDTDSLYLAAEDSAAEFQLTYGTGDSNTSLTTPGKLPSHEDLVTASAQLRNFIEIAKKAAKESISVVQVRTSQQPKIHQSLNAGGPIKHYLSAAISSINSVKVSLADVQQKLVTLENQHSNALKMKQREIDTTRILLFTKERERLEALAMVACQCCGWLRVGSAQKTGQRGSLSASLNPLWAALRKSVLFLFADPRQAAALEAVLLQDASIQELSGGQRKSDLKRSFGIVDKSGTVHIVVAPNDNDYDVWTREISLAIHFFSKRQRTDSHISEDAPGSCNGGSNIVKSSVNKNSSNAAVILPSSSEGLSSNKDETGGISKHCEEDNVTAESQGGNLEATGSLNALVVVDSALAEASVEDDSQKVVSKSSDIVDTGIQRYENSQKILQMRNKFSIVGQAAKKGFGSALLATKQKAIEVAEKRRLKMEAVITSSPNPDKRLFPSSSFVSATETNTSESRQKDDNDGTDRAPSNELDMEPKILFRSKLNGIDDQSVISDIMDETDDVESTVGLRQRFGAAVRNVRLSTTNISESKRFGFLKRDNGQSRGDDTVMGIPDCTKIKNIFLKGDLPNTTIWDTSNLHEAVPWKQLKGDWYAKVVVTACVPESAPIAKDENIGYVVKPFETKNNPGDIGNVVTSDSSEGDQMEMVGEAEDEPLAEIVDEVLPTDIDDDLQFCIQVWQQHIEQPPAEPIKIVKRLSDILNLHTSISESLARLPPGFLCNNDDTLRTEIGSMSSNLKSILGLTTLEVVVLTGRLLGGLLRFSVDNKLTSFDYHGQVVAQFLNSIMSSPVPADAMFTFSEFLSLPTDAILHVDNLNFGDKLLQLKAKSDSSASAVKASSICSSITSLCTKELIIAEVDCLRALKIAESTPQAVAKPSTDECQIHYTSNSQLSRNFFANATYSALYQALEERDELLVKMMSSSALYTHQIDQERENVNKLAMDIDALKKSNSSFGSVSSKVLLSSNQEVSANSRNPTTSSGDFDAELVSLCQQLSAEITARTASSLELLRSQSSWSVERRSREAEIQSLQDELAETKRNLAKERDTTAFSAMECEKWKHAFQAISSDLETDT